MTYGHDEALRDLAEVRQARGNCSHENEVLADRLAAYIERLEIENFGHVKIYQDLAIRVYYLEQENAKLRKVAEEWETVAYWAVTDLLEEVGYSGYYEYAEDEIEAVVMFFVDDVRAALKEGDGE